MAHVKQIRVSRLPEPLYQGKVRELRPVDSRSLLMVTSDRISAFDVVFPQTLKDKGKILNQISCAWCHALEAGENSLCERYDFSTHLINDQFAKLPEPYCQSPKLEDRAIHIKKTKRIDFECIVRGYLVGSAWKEYQSRGSVSGIALESGLQMGAKLPQPLFTPSTKAGLGQHDVNVSYERMQKKLGSRLSENLRDISLALYNFSVEKMDQCDIIVADTKFEFGLDEEGRLVLIDEVLTPDSSRFWRVTDYYANFTADSAMPPGFDKQHIRDYLETLQWNKEAPAPDLPSIILRRTLKLYKEIQLLITEVL